MNDLPSDLEKELMELAPAKPSDEFTARLSEALGEQGNLAVINRKTQEDAKILPYPGQIGWGIAAAAALVAGILGAAHYFQSQASEKFANTPVMEWSATPAAHHAEGNPLVGTPASWHPTGSKTILVDVRDEGVVRDPVEPPSRLLRYQYLDTTTYTGNDPNSQMQMAVPREQVVRVKMEPY
jgi:hypothetical protein